MQHFSSISEHISCTIKRGKKFRDTFYASVNIFHALLNTTKKIAILFMHHWRYFMHLQTWPRILQHFSCISKVLHIIKHHKWLPLRFGRKASHPNEEKFHTISNQFGDMAKKPTPSWELYLRYIRLISYRLKYFGAHTTDTLLIKVSNLTRCLFVS